MLTYFVCTFGLILAVAEAAVRVEYKLTSLNNTQGILANGKKCDIGSKCDPVLTGYVDNEKPLNAWPGPKPKSEWNKIFEATDEDSPKVNRIVSRDLCSGSFSKSNLRVDAQDKDVTTSDQLEQFECLSGREVQPRESSATWSAEKPCDSKYQPNKILLKYSWRAFTIPDRECGRPVGSHQVAG